MPARRTMKTKQTCNSTFDVRCSTLDVGCSAPKTILHPPPPAAPERGGGGSLLALLPLLLAAAVALPGVASGQTNYTPYTFTTLAGLMGGSGNADGTGSAARFFWPSGVAVDTNGNVFVADYYNSTIRMVTAAGEVTP